MKEILKEKIRNYTPASWGLYTKNETEARELSNELCHVLDLIDQKLSEGENPTAVSRAAFAHMTAVHLTPHIYEACEDKFKMYELTETTINKYIDACRIVLSDSEKWHVVINDK